MTALTRVALLVVLLGALVAGLSTQLPKVQWHSSLADALPNQVSDTQRAYLDGQQPSTQQLLIAFEQPDEDASLLLTRVQTALTSLFQQAPDLRLAELTDTQSILAFYQNQAGRLATPQDRQRLQQGQFDAVIQSAQQTLQSPEPVLVPVTQDPLLLTQRYLKNLPNLMPGYKNQQGLYVREQGGSIQVLVPLQVAADALSIDDTERVVTHLNQFLVTVKDTAKNITSYRSGLIFHANAGANQAKQEMTWFGGLSLGLILTVLVWTFRSPVQLLYTLSLLSVASAVGLLATVLWSSTPHLLMLVFATSFIGLCIDYVIHGFIARSHGASAWEALKPALWLGGLTTVSGYVLLLLVPLPLLQQLGVFMAAALLSAIALVVITLPWLPTPKKPHPVWQTCCKKTANVYEHLRTMLHPRWLSVLPLMTVIILLAAYATNDSVRLLASSPKQLVSEENHLRQSTDFYFSPRVVLVSGDTKQQALERTATIDTSDKTLSMTDYTLPLSAQQQVLDAQQPLFASNVGRSYLNWLGIKSPNLHTEPATHPLESQFLYSFQQGWLSVVRLHQNATEPNLNDKPWAERFNPIEHASQALGSYRHSMQFWLCGLLGISFIILLCFMNRADTWRDRFAASWHVFCVIVLSVSTALLVAQLNQPLNLFHWIGAMFVLVLSIDYGVFCSGRLKRAHALQAIYLSALTTLVAFGTLMFSATPAIAAFGQVVMVGVLVSVIFCPLIQPRN